jgi:hypothetical protein
MACPLQREAMNMVPCSMLGGHEGPEGLPDYVHPDTWGQVFADLTLGERMKELSRRYEESH